MDSSSTSGASTRLTSARAATRSISLVLPAYNEEAIIAQAIREADEALAGICDDYEVIVVNDGSRDRTAELATEEAKNRPHVRIISQPRNLGYGAALRRGFAEARYEYVGFSDSDCQFDLRELDRLAMLARDYDIVTGYRIDRKDPWLRLLYSGTYNLIVRTLLNTGARDCDCALKLFHRDVVKQITIETSGYLVNAEMLARARSLGYSMVEVGVSHRPRGGGESKVSIRDVFPVLCSLLRFWWNWALFPAKSESSSIVMPAQRANEAKTLPFASGWIGGVILGLLACFLFLTHLSFPLFEPDESRYAQIAMEMHNSGDYVVPKRFGMPYLDKPPLLYWLTSASFNAFGVSEYAARLPSCLAAIAGILAMYFIGREMIGDRAAFLGSCLLLFSVGFLVAGRYILMDGMLTLFTTLTFLALYRGAGQARFRPWWWLFGSITCGLGVLTKGPIAVVLCLPPLIAHRWLTRQEPLSWRRWAMFFAPVAAISIPWLVAVADRQSEFLGYFFWKHNVVRFVNAFNHREAWWFYLPTLAIGMFPVSLLFPAHAAALFSRDQALRSQRSPESGYFLLAGGWVVAFFSAASCKLPPYILPAFPMLCLGIGRTLEAIATSTQTPKTLTYFSQRLPQWIVGSMAILATLLATSLATGVPFGKGPPSALYPAMFVAALVCGAVFVASQSRPLSWRTSGVATFAVMASALLCYYPQIAKYRSINSEAIAYTEELSDPAQQVVYFDREAGFSPFAFQGRKVHCISSGGEDMFSELIRKNPETLILTNPTNLRQLKGIVPSYLELKPVGNRGRVYVTRRKDATISIAERPDGAPIQ